MNNNMINPASYYNPFAKYNYISKTRGVYIPKDTEPLLKEPDAPVQKTSNIFSENYDAETEVNECLKNDTSNGLLGFIDKFFKN